MTLSRGSVHVSDQTAFNLDGSKALLIGYNLAANSYASFVSGLGANNFVTYLKINSQEATDSPRGLGYTAAGGQSPFLQKLECFS